MARVYIQVYKEAELGRIKPVILGNISTIHLLSRPDVHRVLVLIASFLRYASIFTIVIANFACATSPECRGLLQHNGFHGMKPKHQTPATARPEQVAAHGIGRITRHPINVSMFCLALSHILPIKISQTWEVNLWFWFPQMVLACLGAILHDRRLRREPNGLYKRYLKETTCIPSIPGFLNMPESELQDLVVPGILAATITSAFWKVKRLNKIMYSPLSVWIPLAMLTIEVATGSFLMLECCTPGKSDRMSEPKVETNRAPSNTVTR
jgi:protein-S-isoprenylcysteine O-methyltransferase Ste14